jgi:sulfofructose kinase
VSAQVIGIGLATVDYLCVVDRFPEPDSKTAMVDFAIQGGGPVATALVALQRLGLRTVFAGTMGDDSLGQFLLDDLRREGVDISCVELHEGRQSPFAYVTVERGTGRRNVAYRDPGLPALAPGGLTLEFLREARALHVDGHQMQAQLHAATAAREWGIPVIYDAGSVRKHCAELIALTDYLVTSEAFPADFTGMRKLPRAMEKLMEYGPRAVVTTLGARGCRFVGREGQGEVPPFPVDQIADTTGAGDVFHGAFVFGIVQGWDLRRTCDFANIAAAIKCRGLGARDPVPTLQEVERAILHRGLAR